jgi:hypothetical protein
MQKSHEVDKFAKATPKINAIHNLSKEPQKTTEDQVPIIVAASSRSHGFTGTTGKVASVPKRRWSCRKKVVSE